MIETSRKTLIVEYLVCLFLVGVVYIVSVAPGVLWQDNGLAQIRAYLQDFRGNLGLALAHPLFYMIAQIFQLLPFKDPAFKTNLVACVFGILTVANVYLFLSLILKDKAYRRFSAIIGAGTLALAHTFWQHSAMCEVYSVTTFFLTIELICFVKFLREYNPFWFYLLWFFNGVECSNHVLALLTLFCIILWSAEFLKRKKITFIHIVCGFAFWIIGALPYELFGLMEYISGTALTEVIKSMLFGLHYKTQVLNTNITLKMILISLAIIVLNFPTPNLLLIFPGIRRSIKVIHKQMYGFLILATIVHFLFAVRYNVRDQYTFFIITVLFFSIWIGLGASVVVTKYKKFKLPILVFLLFPPIVYSFLPYFVERFKIDLGYYPAIPYREEAKYFLVPWKTGYRGPQKFAEEVFKIVPKNSLIIVDSTASRPLVYYQLVYGKRRDIKITYALFPLIKDKSEKVEKLRELIKKRDCYIVRPYPGYCPRWVLNNFRIVKAGPIYKIVGIKPRNL